jgi:integrase/recombinase XerD
MPWKNYNDEGYKTGEFALTPNEVENLLSHCDTLFEKVLLEVGISTGCRRSDLCAIKKSNIDLTNMTISYIEKKKGSRIKMINFGNKLRTDLKQYIATLPPKCEWLFPSDHGTNKHISDRTVWNVLNRVCERSGISKRPAHALRSTFVKQAISNGWSMSQIANHIGDTEQTVEKYYAVPSIGEMSEVARNKEVI